MKIIKKYYKLILSGIFLFLAVYFWKWFIILMISFIFAYLLDPVVELLEKIKVKRIVGIIAVLVVMLLVFSILSGIMVPALVRQVDKLNDNLPEYTNQIKDIVEYARMKVISLKLENTDIVSGLMSKLEYFITLVTNTIIKLLLFLLSSIPLVILMFVFVFYMLKDKDFFYEKFLKLFESRKKGIRVMQRINESVMGYVKGTLLDCLLVGLILTIGFYIFKLKYALIAGSIAGLFVIIPYIGPVIGVIPAVVIAIIQFGNVQKIIFLLLFIGIVQLINGYVVQPKIIGDEVHFHPIAVLFIVIIGTTFLGGMGLFISIPAAIILRESINSFIK